MIGKIPEPRTRQEFLNMSIGVKTVFEMCVQVQKHSNAKIKVGCVVEALEFRLSKKFSLSESPLSDFQGCNLHVSDSFGDTHAERMAIDQALKEKCYPIAVYVTSTSFQENVLLCGSCRHYISEINENCNIVVFNPDGTIKEVSTIKDSYPNHKDVKKKNQMFYEYCAGLSDIKKGN